MSALRPVNFASFIQQFPLFAYLKQMKIRHLHFYLHIPAYVSPHHKVKYTFEYHTSGNVTDNHTLPD